MKIVMQIDQNIFYEEFLDKIDSLGDALVEIQNDYSNSEYLNEIFRAIHTVKGTADLLGMFDVVTVIHKSEDLLDLIRHGEVQMDKTLCSLYLELKEFLSLSLDNTANGVYDDPITQNLAIYFEKEFNKYLQMVKSGELSSLATKTILVVEGTSINRYMVKKVASDEGYSTFMCDNGVEASKKIKDNDIDLIFCSVTKDCEKCREFLLQLHGDILYNHIPVVLIVDYLSEDIRKLAQKVGAKAWLKKPIELPKLTTVLNKFLEK